MKYQVGESKEASPGSWNIIAAILELIRRDGEKEVSI